MKDYYFKFDISESVSNYTHFNDFMKDNILDMLAFCDFYNETGDKVDIKSFKIKHPGEHMIALYDNAKERISANSEYYHLTEDEKALDSTEPRISYII